MRKHFLTMFFICILIVACVAMLLIQNQMVAYTLCNKFARFFFELGQNYQHFSLKGRAKAASFQNHIKMEEKF